MKCPVRGCCCCDATGCRLAAALLGGAEMGTYRGVVLLQGCRATATAIQNHAVQKQSLLGGEGLQASALLHSTQALPMRACPGDWAGPGACHHSLSHSTPQMASVFWNLPCHPIQRQIYLREQIFVRTSFMNIGAGRFYCMCAKWEPWPTPVLTAVAGFLSWTRYSGAWPYQRRLLLLFK